MDTIRSFKSAAADVYDIDTTGSPEPAKPKTKRSAPKTDESGADKVASPARNPTAKKDGDATVKKPRKSRAKKSDEVVGEDLGEDGEPKEPAPTKPRKPRVKKSDEVVGEDGEAKEPKKPRKPRAKKSDEVVGEDGEPKEPAPKKSRTKKPITEENGEGPVKEKGVRKPRPKKAAKAEGDTQTKLSKGRVTKSSASEEASNSKQLKSTIASTDNLDFGLVEAVSRRTAWTPPPANSMALETPTPIGVEAGIIDSFESEEKAKGFKDLFGSFGFTTSAANPTEKSSSDGAGTRKRKLIELVKTNVSEAETVAAVPKPKAPKKKARTITEQATSAYREEAEEPPVEPAPLLQYFSYKSATDTNDGFKIPLKPRSKSPVKGPKKSKKGSAQAPILLSPESALKQVVTQDFVFGTSSQLAREESPTFLRDLHRALQVSNQVEDDPFADIFDELSSPAPVSGRGKALASNKRTLWSAGARDTSGDLLDVEMLDMVDSPAVAKMLQASATQASVASMPIQDDEWPDIDDLTELTASSSVEKAPPTKAGPVEAAIRAELLKTPPKSSNQQSKPSKPPNSRKTVNASQPNQASRAPPPPPATQPQCPDYESYTTIQLAREVASYRFKPVKSRDSMITLLERCWEGKNRVALGTLGTNLLLKSPGKAPSSSMGPPPSSQARSPKKPLGRPKKNSTASAEVSPAKSQTKAKAGRPRKSDTIEFLELDSDAPLSQIRTPKKSQKKPKKPVEEISDSDTPMTPSPPRRLASQLGKSPLPLRPSTTADEEGGDLTFASSQVSLFSHITKAVTSFPPSTDPSKPNWQEKILLYDPIVLEDLTLWLNTGALDKVGWDGEVDPKEVKKWCESKSVCCLWKENLRGGPRSRY